MCFFRPQGKALEMTTTLAPQRSRTAIRASYGVADLLDVLGLASPASKKRPKPRNDEIAFFHNGCTMMTLRGGPVGKERMYQNDPWYDEHEWPVPEAGYYRVLLRPTGCNNMRLQEQIAYLKTFDHGGRDPVAPRQDGRRSARGRVLPHGGALRPHGGTRTPRRRRSPGHHDRAPRQPFVLRAGQRRTRHLASRHAPRRGVTHPRRNPRASVLRDRGFFPPGWRLFPVGSSVQCSRRGYRITAITPVFQTGDAGSTPATRSTLPLFP